MTALTCHFVAALVLASASGPVHAVAGLVATGHDSRIDLRWEPVGLPDTVSYDVYRSERESGPFVKLNDAPHQPHVYSDFFGENGRTYSYRVTAVQKGGVESPPSAIVSARSRAMSDEELLTSVQEATFRYFWDWSHPVSSLARTRNTALRTCTSGGTGFGLMAIMVGADRGFVSREEAAERVLKIVTFLGQEAQRFHGVWSHWIDGATGRARRFSPYDDAADLVETSFLIEGMLTVRQYFDRDSATEREIRGRITRLWEEVEWDWFLREPGGTRLYWHWSPNHGWKMNHRIGGRFNECMITYLLALASPTHTIPPSCYYEGWAGPPETYANGNTYYGHKQWVGRPRGGPLFFTHYSFLGFDPRGKRDRYCNYFENNRNISLINRAYCIENPKGHDGYGELVWGLTASHSPDGYQAHAPGPKDNGTIAPTAAISAMPYTPEESLATLKHFYHEYGDRLWGEFGFKDAFNPGRDWFCPYFLAIDQGPIICMIENYRTGLCWRMFMANPEIAPMLAAIGWEDDEAP
jgi:hypothetical protein